MEVQGAAQIPRDRLLLQFPKIVRRKKTHHLASFASNSASFSLLGDFQFACDSDIQPLLMSHNKRRRTGEKDAIPKVSALFHPKSVQKLRLSNELACKLGMRHCIDEELVNLMISASVCSKVVVNTISPQQLASGSLKLCRLTQIKLGPLLQPHFEMLETIFDWQVVQLFLANGIITRVTTFEVKATLMGDLNKWMTITLDGEHASTADVKEGIEQATGIRPAMQELFRYDESWTGTKGSGGSGHSASQEDAALVEEGFLFEGPCSLMVSVNESYAVVLEGQEEGELGHRFMGVYERVEGKEINGKGVWQALGGIERFLYHYIDTGPRWIVCDMLPRWIVSDRESMEAGNGASHMRADSTTATPDQISGEWMVYNSTAGTVQAQPKLRVQVCSSVEKHAAEQRVEQDHEQALAQAQQQLVLEGAEEELGRMMGSYSLMEGKVVSRRAVWQMQGGRKEWFLYYASDNSWWVSTRVHMENGNGDGFMHLHTAALTPDQSRPSEVWSVDIDDDGTWVASPGVRVSSLPRRM
jgi:hypothetical protein